jgi:hypothetical protein
MGFIIDTTYEKNLHYHIFCIGWQNQTNHQKNLEKFARLMNLINEPNQKLIITSNTQQLSQKKLKVSQAT